WKRHRLTQRQLELRFIDGDLLSFLQMLRHHANDGKRRLRCLGSADAEIVRSRDAAADAPATGVLEPREMGGAPGDGEIERRIGQHQRLPWITGLVKPSAQYVDHPFAQRRRREYAAVEKKIGRASCRERRKIE